MRRRLPGVLVVLAAIVLLVVFARDTPAPAAARFSITAEGWMPSAPPTGGLLESWFCPGVPATGEDGVEGAVLVTNRGETQLTGTILVINDQGETRRLDLTVEPWSTSTLDLDATLPSRAVGAVVEIEGGGALVEQRSFDPDGNSSSACANATSDQWYLADGFTVDGSLDEVVLSNPFEQTVVVDIAFATKDGYREPGSYKGLTVPPRSIRLIDLGAPGAGAQSEPILAVDIQVVRGRLAVGRVQRFTGGGRAGTQVTLAQPATREQWWFADGDKGPGIDEQFVIYNPTGETVEADVLFIGIDQPVEQQTAVLADPIVVLPRQAVVYESGPEAGLGEGGHATVVAEATSSPSLVVERVTTVDDGDDTGTSVLAGAVARQDGYVAQRWYVAQGPDEVAEDALVLYNVDNTEGTVTVSVVGHSGPVPIAGLTDVPYGPAQRIELDLTDPLVVGRPLVIEATNRVFVETKFPNGVGALRTAAWAIPEG